MFGLEEFEKQDGTIGTMVKLTQFRSLDKLKDVQIPKVKLIDDTYVTIEEYQKKQSQKTNDEVVLKGEKIDDFINNNLLD